MNGNFNSSCSVVVIYIGFRAPDLASTLQPHFSTICFPFTEQRSHALHCITLYGGLYSEWCSGGIFTTSVDRGMFITCFLCFFYYAETFDYSRLLNNTVNNWPDYAKLLL